MLLGYLTLKSWKVLHVAGYELYKSTNSLKNFTKCPKLHNKSSWSEAVGSRGVLRIGARKP